MAEGTAIEWADHTFNPWIGCTKVSPGCDNCYAARREDDRLHRVKWGVGQPRHRTKTWGDPARWNRAHAAFFAEHGRRQRVFCASLADVFDNEVNPAWRADLFELIEATPSLDWLLLTKRIGNAAVMIRDALDDVMRSPRGWPWPNVWLGATVVNQAEADRDIPKLLATPARVRFLSIEPVLGLITLYWQDLGGSGGINWVIAGGESGPKARPAHPDWFRTLRDQCAAAGVPFMFKQHGEWARGGDLPDYIAGSEYCDFDGDLKHDNERVWKVGKKAAGRLLDGVTHDGFPEAVHA